MTTIQLILIILLAYILGSIPTAVWVGKLFYKTDVRSKGSGNAGATNTIRVLGWKAGVPVLLFDVFKGWLAIKLPEIFDLEFLTPDQLINYKIALGVAVVLGHVFPIFAGFRGGKGVASLLGVGLALYPYSVLVIIAIFIIVLITTRYVSAGSIIGAIAFPFVDIFLFHQEYLSLIILSVAVGVFVPLTHRKNIKRLLQGTESKFI